MSITEYMEVFQQNVDNDRFIFQKGHVGDGVNE